jgi:hypothetical protein
MKRLSYTFLPALLLALALGACEDGGPLDPANSPSWDAAAFDADRAGSPALGVMSWNIYVGADLNQLLAIADPSQIACGVAGVWADVRATDFASRAEAIVDQIEASNPHVIGLNEVSTFDFLYNSVDDDLVFLDILTAELDSRGLDYSVPADAVSTNFTIQLPISYAPNCEIHDAITYTEYDVLLVRDDVPVLDSNHGNFAMPLPLPLPGGDLPKFSGWASVDITLKSLPYRIFTTHLEPADTGPCDTGNPGLLYIHNEQANELRSIVAGSEYPVVLMGDLNSDASGCTTDTYEILLGDGFVDAWTIGKPLGRGYTSNQDDDLLNAASELSHRIDFVLYRDAFTAEKGVFRGSSHAFLVGEDRADKTSGGLWPSDHAGVVAELRIAPGMR